MSEIAYTVVATLPDHQTAQEYIDWLAAGHVAAVIAGGASSGQVVRVDEPNTPIQVETRYTFPNRACFERYLSDHAPALRADGMRRFGSRPGIAFDRRIGTIL